MGIDDEAEIFVKNPEAYRQLTVNLSRQLCERLGIETPEKAAEYAFGLVQALLVRWPESLDSDATTRLREAGQALADWLGR